MTTYPDSWSPGDVGADEQGSLSPQDLLGAVDDHESRAAEPPQAGGDDETAGTTDVGGAGATSSGGGAPAAPEHWAVDGESEPFAADVELTPVTERTALAEPEAGTAPQVAAEPDRAEREARPPRASIRRALGAVVDRCRAWAPAILAPALLLVNTALLAAALATLCLGIARPAAPRPAPRQPSAPGLAPVEAYGKDPGPTLELPEFVVHLRDGPGPVRRARDGRAGRFAWVTLEIQLPDAAAKEAASIHLPRIRDAFLAYLSDRTAHELRGGQAFRAVKRELAHRLSEVAPEVPVRDLYVTRFVFQ